MKHSTWFSRPMAETLLWLWIGFVVAMYLSSFDAIVRLVISAIVS